MSQLKQKGMQIFQDLAEEDAKSVVDFMLFIQVKHKNSIEYANKEEALEISQTFLDEYRHAYEVLGQ